MDTSSEPHGCKGENELKEEKRAKDGRFEEKRHLGSPIPSVLKALFGLTERQNSIKTLSDKVQPLPGDSWLMHGRTVGYCFVFLNRVGMSNQLVMSLQMNDSAIFPWLVLLDDLDKEDFHVSKLAQTFFFGVSEQMSAMPRSERALIERQSDA